MRYRHALAEYLFAEEEYKALLRAREEARLRARVEEGLRRQKMARLLQAEIVRSRREAEVRDLELALAKTLSRAAASKGHRSFRGVAPAIHQISNRHLIDPLVTPHLHDNASRAGVEKESPELLRDASAVQASVGDKVCTMSTSCVHSLTCMVSPNLSTTERRAQVTADRHVSPLRGLNTPFPI